MKLLICFSLLSIINLARAQRERPNIINRPAWPFHPKESESNGNGNGNGNANTQQVPQNQGLGAHIGHDNPFGHSSPFMPIPSHPESGGNQPVIQGSSNALPQPKPHGQREDHSETSSSENVLTATHFGRPKNRFGKPVIGAIMRNIIQGKPISVSLSERKKITIENLKRRNGNIRMGKPHSSESSEERLIHHGKPVVIHGEHHVFRPHRPHRPGRHNRSTTKGYTVTTGVPVAPFETTTLPPNVTEGITINGTVVTGTPVESTTSASVFETTTQGMIINGSVTVGTPLPSETTTALPETTTQGSVVDVTVFTGTPLPSETTTLPPASQTDTGAVTTGSWVTGVPVESTTSGSPIQPFVENATETTTVFASTVETSTIDFFNLKWIN